MRHKTRLSPYFDRMKSNRIAGIAALLLGALLFMSFPALANAPTVAHEVRAWLWFRRLWLLLWLWY
ncbi:MAG: hypothetical protein ACKOX4_04100 [Bacteroidota bacterium]